MAAATATDPAAQYKLYGIMLPKFRWACRKRASPRTRDASQAQVEQPGAYVLQVGSRNRDEAERVRSKVEKLGIEAKVQHVSIDTDELHCGGYAVRDLSKLNSTRRELRAAV